MTSPRIRIISCTSALALALALGGACAQPAWASSFTDVPADHWAETSGIIDRAVAEGIIKGTDNGDGTVSLRPDAPVTRAEAATMLMRIAGADDNGYSQINQTSFVDIPSGAWYIPSINWAAETGILTGSGGYARPNDPISRQELACMLTRYLANVAHISADADEACLADYPDQQLIASWARPAVAWTVAQGILGGNVSLAPTEVATRAQTAKMLVVFKDLLGDQGTTDAPDNGPDDTEIDTSATSAVEIALQFEGYPYCYGGASPETGFDCSGLVMYAYAQLGISLPHSASAQLEELRIRGRRVVTDVADLQYGDLAFFPGHVAFYIGDGQVFGARREGVPASAGNLEWFGTFLGGGQF